MAGLSSQWTQDCGSLFLFFVCAKVKVVVELWKLLLELFCTLDCILQPPIPVKREQAQNKDKVG